MALYSARPRPLALAGWWGGLLVIPLVLAGVGLTWPAPEIGGPLAISVALVPVPVPAALKPSQPRGAVAAALASAGTITFDADRADLTGPSAATVRRIAHVLGTGAGFGVGVVLTGYAADTPGPAVVAQRLSEQRASVVADALVSAGIDRSRIVSTGRGAADPLATPAASRRVEISLQ